MFINASGYLNSWRWPSVSGRENYQGILTHGANYDPDIDLWGKRVAVIGNGSSGIQVTVAVQKYQPFRRIYSIPSLYYS